MKTIHLGYENDDQRIRQEWADSLADHMANWVDPATGAQGMSRKELAKRLRDVAKREVTQQAISTWLTATNSPRPSVQIALAQVFNVPARSLFPLTPAAAA